jgi:hypothetical protein
LRNLLIRARKLRELSHSNEEAAMREISSILHDYDEWEKERNQWVNQNGAKYNLQLRKKSK